MERTISITSQGSQGSQTSLTSPTKPSETKYHLFYTIVACVNANLGFLFYNYNMAIFNSVLPYLNKFLFPKAASGAITFVASAPVITGAIAALFTGYLTTKFGRRVVMIVCDIIAIIGVVLCLFPNLPMMIVGRLLIGFDLGITTVAVPLYFTELSPIKYRGAFSALPPLLASAGVLLAFGLGLLVPDTLAPGETNNMWRILQGVSISMAGLRALNLLIFFRYDTPTYYVYSNHLKEAKHSLMKVYKKGSDERLEELVKERDYVNAAGKVTFFQLFTKKYRKALLVCAVMMSVNMLCGVSVLIVYSKTIFAYGITDPNNNLPEYLSIALAGNGLLMSFVSIWFSNRFNRKPVLVGGTLLMAIIELLFAVVGQTTHPGNIISKIILLFFPIPFCLSIGSVLMIMVPETLPPIGVSVTVLFNWIWGFLSVQFYPEIAEAIGIPETFYIFGGICLLASIFFFFLAVETKNQDRQTILEKYSGLKTKVKEAAKAEGRQIEHVDLETNDKKVPAPTLNALNLNAIGKIQSEEGKILSVEVD